LGHQRSPSTIQSIERAAAVMRCFTESEPELGVTELSTRTGLHKSTVARILTTLQNEGFISQNSRTGKYRLGVGLISLAGVALGRVDIRSAAYDHLDSLVEVTQESVSVSIRDGAESMNVLSKPSPKPIRFDNWTGRRLPLHCSASGKVLLAGLLPEERKPLIVRVRRYTDRTIVGVRDLEEVIAQVEHQGYALAENEFEQGFSAIAAPIFNHEGVVIGALSISGPSFRLDTPTLTSFLPALINTAAEISTELGFDASYSQPV
jgi:IclR family transcriptional regulator, acetate operon repressor